MYECAAITIFLCDRHTRSKASTGHRRARTQLISSDTCLLFKFCSDSIPARLSCSYRFADTPADEPSAQRRGHRRLRETWQIINDQIGDNQWILGDQFSAADIYLFMLTTWLEPSRGQPTIHEFPNVRRIADAVMLRPSVQLVMATR